MDPEIDSFIVWLAVRDRLSTGCRMKNWNGNVDSSFIFCQDPLEYVEHLFFECSFSKQIWEVLIKGVLDNQYTANWFQILRLITRSDRNKIKAFTVRYVFQTALHSIWRERNRRRHGENAAPPALMVKMIDRTVRNKFSIMKKLRVNDMEGGLRFWFETRQNG